MKKAPFYLILLSCLLVLGTCRKQALFKNIVYQGIVYDNRQSPGQPLAGVTIYLEACSNTFDGTSDHCSNKRMKIGQSVTDNNGHFYIKEKAASTDMYYVYKGLGNAREVVNSSDGTTGSGLNTTPFTAINYY